MEKHFEIDDKTFEKQFQSLALDPTLFTHEAHLRLAWTHIRKYGIDKAISHICTQIRAFATAYDDHDKYNLTVTVAAVRAVHHFRLKSQASNFFDFITAFPQLKSEFKKLLDSHYSIDIFQSEIAKREYIAPDLQPFD